MKIAYIILTVFLTLGLMGQENSGTSLFKSEYSYQYALIEASRQKMIGNINEARNLYLSCIKANPECDVAYYELGTVLSALGENTKAEENLAMAYQLDKKNYWYGIAYSELLKINNKPSESIKVLHKTRKLNKENALTIDFKIAEIYSEKGKYKAALKLLQKMEMQNGISEIISFKKHEIFKLQGKFKDAEEVLKRLAVESPETIEYQIILAEFYTERGDSVMALKAYEQAFKIDSTNVYAITNLADIYTSMGAEEKGFYFLNRAFKNENIPVNSKIQTMMYLNKDRELIKKNGRYIDPLVSNLLSQYPDNVDVKTVAYDFYNGLEDHMRAMNIIKEILLTVKDDYMIWQQALYNASMLDNYDELIIVGEEALKYFPNKSEMYLFLGMAYFQKDFYEKAYNILSAGYSSIKEGDKMSIQFQLFLSEAAYKTDRKTEAYSYFDMLIINDPGNDLTKNNYSYYLALDSINLEKAKDLSYSTLINSPENSTYLDTYAWILFQSGDYRNAEIFIEKAMKINALADPDIIFHYAEILNKLEKFAEAEKFYNIALDRGYSNEIIEKKLKELTERLR